MATRKFFSMLTDPASAHFAEVFDDEQKAHAYARQHRIRKLVVVSVKDGKLVRETAEA